MLTQDFCKDCEKTENIKEVLKVHAELIETNRKDIAEIKAQDKETRLYVKMILEKIEYLTIGFENLRQEKEKERVEKIKQLESNRKKEEQEIKEILVDNLWLAMKILLVMIAVLGGIKAANILEVLKFLQ